VSETTKIFDRKHGVWLDVKTLPTTGERTKKTRPRPDDRFFGCPIWWLRAVLPVVKGKSELVVAIYLFRLRHVTKSKTVVVPNKWLRENGVSRFVKCRALARLERAGLIAVERRGRVAPEVKFLR
jgi:hypothetical protein